MGAHRLKSQRHRRTWKAAHKRHNEVWLPLVVYPLPVPPSEIGSDLLQRSESIWMQILAAPLISDKRVLPMRLHHLKFPLTTCFCRFVCFGVSGRPDMTAAKTATKTDTTKKSSRWKFQAEDTCRPLVPLKPQYLLEAQS